MTRLSNFIEALLDYIETRIGLDCQVILIMLMYMYLGHIELDLIF
jgi:hypothetical protein